jgi:hypothetical protein
MSSAVHSIFGDDRAPPCPAPPRGIVADLPTNERLFLWALRLTAENCANAGIVQQELWLCCGLANVEKALQALGELIHVLRREGRRPLLVKPSEARRMNACEESVVSLIAAGRDGDVARLSAHARWLVRPLAQSALIAQALRLGQVFPSDS